MNAPIVGERAGVGFGLVLPLDANGGGPVLGENQDVPLVRGVQLLHLGPANELFVIKNE